MSRVRSGVNFRRIQAEHSEWMNAFNNSSRMEYWYQYRDMAAVGERIFRDDSRLEEKVVFIPPFGVEHMLYGLGEIDQGIVNRLTQQKELQKFRGELEEGKKLVGVYSTGGNHWIAYCIYKNHESGEIRCFYKDSLDGDRVDFETIMRGAFTPIVVASGEKRTKAVTEDAAIGGAGSEPIVYDREIEESTVSVTRVDKGRKDQADGSSCGIYALKNMMVFAEREVGGIVESGVGAVGAGEGSEIGSIFYHGTREDIGKVRKDFGDIYLREVVNLRLDEFLSRQLVHNNADKAQILKDILIAKKLSSDLISKCKFDVEGDKASSHGYLFKISIEGIGEEQVRDIASLKRQLVKKSIVREQGEIEESFSNGKVIIKFSPSSTEISRLKNAVPDGGWRNGVELSLEGKTELLEHLVREVRPFSLSDLESMETVLLSIREIGESVRGYLVGSGVDHTSSGGALLVKKSICRRRS